MNFKAGDWLGFVQDHWIVVVIAIVAIFIIGKVVQTVLKWVLIAAILIAIVWYGGYSIDDLGAIKSKVTEEIGKVGDKVTTEVRDQAMKAMIGEASEATYVNNEDGSYTITTKNLELRGVPNSGEVDVKFHGQSLGTWKMEGAVRDFVNKSRAAAK
jgi:hypothetical protein